MLISRARRFYEHTATLRDNLAAGGAFAMATVALALLARLLLPAQIGSFPFLAFIPAILSRASSAAGVLDWSRLCSVPW